MIQALQKTADRTGQFMGNALTCRSPDREYAPVAWALVAGVIWLSVVRLAMDPDWIVTTAASFYLLSVLAAVSAIDARYGIIPDSLVLGLAAGGATQTYLVSPGQLLERSGEAVAAFVAVSAFRSAYRLIRGHDGLGFGDVKFVAAGVLWIGIARVPGLILVGVLSALANLALLKIERRELCGQEPISFGPHLAVALWVIWVTGPDFF